MYTFIHVDIYTIYTLYKALHAQIKYYIHCVRRPYIGRLLSTYYMYIDQLLMIH